MLEDGYEADMSLVTSVAMEGIERAGARLRGVANRTPVMTSRTLNLLSGSEAFFKCESFQRAGAFKFRGAYNALSLLDDGQKARGVLAYSSGNHAQAVALASALLGIRAVIVMPSDAPRVKLDATRGYLACGVAGSELVEYDRNSEVREEVGARIAHEQGLAVVPPYDHPDVIAGQGTVALELFEEVGDLDWLLVCVGGGGLLSGCAVAAKSLCPACRVVGVEPALADDATRSYRDRVLRTVRNPGTVADGARTPSLGRYTFPLVLEHVDDMITVGEGEIIEAMRLAWERMKLVIEPTGALALAGLLKDELPTRESRVGVVISGGNVDVTRAGGLFAR